MTEIRGSITDDYIQSRIANTVFVRPEVDPPTLTLCVITLDSGFHVVGKSACVDPNNFDEELGRGIAYQNAYDQLCELLGFSLAEARANG